jgi:hypothetical protein
MDAFGGGVRHLPDGDILVFGDGRVRRLARDQSVRWSVALDVYFEAVAAATDTVVYIGDDHHRDLDADGDPATLSELDAMTGELLATRPVYAWPRAIAVGSRDLFLAVIGPGPYIEDDHGVGGYAPTGELVAVPLR